MMGRELIGRRAIAESLAVTCGEVSRLAKRDSAFPVKFHGRKMVSDEMNLRTWLAKRAARAAK